MIEKKQTKEELKKKLLEDMEIEYELQKKSIEDQKNQMIYQQSAPTEMQNPKKSEGAIMSLVDKSISPNKS